MSQSRGCFKNGLLGCLGLIVIIILITGVTALTAWRGIATQKVAERTLEPQVVTVDDVGTADGGGRVVLELRHSEFEIRRAEPGAGLSVEARYDENSYELLETLERGADGWVYTVGFRRTISGLKAALQAIIGGGERTYVYVYLPDDVPIDLKALIGQGGCEADLGGLWLTNADLRFDKGGFDLSVSEPLKAPLDTLAIRGRMGGFAASRLGNASPGVLNVDCSMGGCDLDLRGAWVNDADINLSINMGGMSVGVPDDVHSEGSTLSTRGLRESNEEVPVPVLRFDYTATRGEIEFSRR